MATTNEPGRLNLRVPRWTPFVYEIAFVGLDFTGASMKLDVRTYRDATGSALISLSNASAGSQGLSVAVATSGGVTTSTVTINISEATIEGVLPFPANGQEPGSDVYLKYDLHVTSESLKRRWLEGDFIILAGVTQ